LDLTPPKPQPSSARPEQGHEDMPQSSQQALPTHEQRLPSQEGHAQEGEDVPVCEAQKKIPVMIRSTGSKSFVDMNDISGMYKWYAHDQFKPEN
jgi:hypothetical protein